MEKEGVIINSQPKKWEANQYLATVGYQTVRYSAGFLKANVANYFKDFYADWTDFFEYFGVQCKLARVSSSLGFPTKEVSLLQIEINKEPCVLVIDKKIKEIILETFLKKNSPHNPNLTILTEYIEKKFLYSLSQSFKGKFPLKFSYLKLLQPVSKIKNNNLGGVICLTFEINGKIGYVWFGLSNKITDKIDGDYKKENALEPDSDADQLRVDLTILLAENAIPTSKVVDYTKVGALIEIGEFKEIEILVEKYNQVIAKGRLYNFNNFFAIKISEVIQPVTRVEDAFSGVTTINVEFDCVEMTQKMLKENLQPGGFIVTAKNLNDLAVALSIGGEAVAFGEICIVDGKLSVLVTERA
jgi:flagellar motor switch/type III secretory pathway protein FliN